MICLNCSTEFEAVRKSAQYCSSKCRVYANRKAEVTTEVEETVCSHCGSKKGAVFTVREVGEAIQEALNLQKAQLDKGPKLPASVNVSGAPEPVISYE